MLICGATTIETSQNAGRPAIAGLAKGRVAVGTNPDGFRGWKGPPGNDLASIETASDSERLDRLSHVAATACEACTAIAPSSSVAIKFLIRVLMVFLLLVVVNGRNGSHSKSNSSVPGLVLSAVLDAPSAGCRFVRLSRGPRPEVSTMAKITSSSRCGGSCSRNLRIRRCW